MNGRIYDPLIGRFISADPFVQFPKSTQGYNRYTYVGNNPLSATDPSGYFLSKMFGKFMSTIAPFMNLIPGCLAWCAGIASAVGGYLQTGSVGAGLRAGAVMSVGSLAGGLSMPGTGFGAFVGRMYVSGMTGGLLSHAGGGRFGDGFLGGAAGSLAGSFGSSNPAANTIIRMIAGGTVAKIGGGNFANGAISGAMAAAVGSGNSGLGGSKSKDADRILSLADAGEGRILLDGRIIVRRDGGSVSDGDLASVASNLEEIFSKGAANGRELRDAILASKDPTTIVLNSSGVNAAGNGTNVLTMDLDSKWQFYDYNSKQFVNGSSARTLAHELSHAVLNKADEAPSITFQVPTGNVTTTPSPAVRFTDGIMAGIDGTQRGYYKNYFE